MGASRKTPTRKAIADALAQSSPAGKAAVSGQRPASAPVGLTARDLQELVLAEIRAGLAPSAAEPDRARAAGTDDRDPLPEWIRGLHAA